MSQINLWSGDSWAFTGCGQLASDAVVAYDRSWFKMTRQKTQRLCLSVADVEDAESLQAINIRRLQGSIVIHLQLENVGTLPDLAEDSPFTFDYTIHAE